MTTITKGAATVTPTLVLGYESRRPSRTIGHDIIGKQDRDYSLAPAARRRGTLHLFFAERVDAWTCYDLHAQAGPFAFTEPEQPDASMVYVIAENGEVEIELEPEGLRRWFVRVPYEEVDL